MQVKGNSKVYFQFDQNLKNLLKKNDYTLLKWIDFEVEQSSECNASVVNKMMASVFDLYSYINIEQTDLFLKTNSLREVIVKIKSPQFELSGNGSTVKETSFTESSQEEQKLGPFLFRNSQREPVFDYKVQMVLGNGKIYESPWASGKGKSLFIGTGNLKSQIPNFPW